jgi:hypothetical protein
MKRREIAKSIERQLHNLQEFQCGGKTEQLPEAEPYDYANQPDDLPSVEHWYKVRECHIYQQERLSQLG